MDPYLATRHDPGMVAAAMLVAVFASYVTLELARRVRNAQASAHVSVARGWWLGGSLAMGTGVWSMHFIAMLGFDAGMRLAYDSGPTFASWLAAVAAAGVALSVAQRPRLTPSALALGASAMAAGICGMHYIGMAALDLAPGIVWNPTMVAASVLVALVASAAALSLFFLLHQLHGLRRLRLQGAAAVVMGIAITGMHFTGMAAAQLPLGAICRNTDGLAGQPLALVVGGVTLLVLAIALVVSINDALRQARELRLARSLSNANEQLQSANDELQRRAFEDVLTGLPNRALFDDRLSHAVARLLRNNSRAGDPSERLAVLFIDLDGFKPINDSYGHLAGDRVLQEVAARLRSAAREADTLARLGGDEFVLLLEGGDAHGAAMQLAQRLIEGLSQPLLLDGRDLSLSASVGIAVFPDHDPGGQRLLACADAAMYAAKRSGGGSYAVYDAAMAGDSGEQMQLQQALRVAVERGELQLYYQPKVRAGDSSFHGLEALLRWRHPQRGMVSPALFIPLAERFGLIGGLGNWVIEEACRQLGVWRSQGRHWRLAINLSPHQLRQPDLVARLRDALARHGLAPEQLVCEITETAMMDHLQGDQDTLRRLAAIGLTLSIDDFGTGYSSLGQLRRIPARQLKIDRSFVQDVATDADARAVLNAVVHLAHALRMEVVAEGVETAEQHAVLRELGCDVLQGYLHARPMPADAVAPWLAQHAATTTAPAEPEPVASASIAA